MSLHNIAAGSGQAIRLPPTQALIAELDFARARLDAASNILQRSIDLREQMGWGILDADELAAHQRFPEMGRHQIWSPVPPGRPA
jgi:hypothetical protein